MAQTPTRGPRRSPQRTNRAGTRSERGRQTGGVEHGRVGVSWKVSMSKQRESRVAGREGSGFLKTMQKRRVQGEPPGAAGQGEGAMALSRSVNTNERHSSSYEKEAMLWQVVRAACNRVGSSKQSPRGKNESLGNRTNPGGNRAGREVPTPSSRTR
jgi:hypothetical protein